MDIPDIVTRHPGNLILTPADIPNVCFISAGIPEKDGTVKMYYGGADTVLCLATAKIADLVDFALKY